LSTLSSSPQVDSALSYLLAFVLPALDAVLPFLPSETVYSFFIGRLGGKAFEDQPWAGFLIAFGGTLVISGLVEVIRRVVKASRRRGSDRSPRPE
jgi:hypothetical protein